MLVCGVVLSLKTRLQVSRQFDKAMKEDRFFIIEQDGKEIGFLSWEHQGDDIFMNNLFVLPTKRSKNNLIHIRKIFRNAFPATKNFYWKNRKHDRKHIVRGRCYEKITV